MGYLRYPAAGFLLPTVNGFSFYALRCDVRTIMNEVPNLERGSHLITI